MQSNKTMTISKSNVIIFIALFTLSLSIIFLVISLYDMQYYVREYKNSLEYCVNILNDCENGFSNCYDYLQTYYNELQKCVIESKGGIE